MDWISVEDRLPKINDWIMCTDGKSVAVTQYLYNCHMDIYFWNLASSGCGCCDKDFENVSHWMPLPRAPNEEK